MSFLLEILIIVALTLVNGILAGAEIAVVAVRATRVEELASEGKRGRFLARLRADPERFLATVQIGITVVSATAGVFGGARWAVHMGGALERLGLSAETANNIAFAVIVVAVSYLSLVLGELVPKSLALKWAEKYALVIARPLLLLGKLLSPIVWVLTASSNLVLRAFGDRTSFIESQVSRDELLGVLDRASDSGQVSHQAADIASRAIELDELHVGSVMVPRAAIVAIEAGATREELGRLLDTTDEERFPVRREPEEVVGYVTTRDVARLLGGRTRGELDSLIRPAHIVPESAPALDVLEQLQSKRIPIAVVVDEAGGVEGIVDIDDLAEELVGTLLVGATHDEGAVTREHDGSFVVPASMRVHVVNRLLDLDLPTSPRWSTIGGLVLANAGAMPTVGTRIEVADVALEVVETGARRIHRVRIVRPHAPAA